MKDWSALLPKELLEAPTGQQLEHLRERHAAVTRVIGILETLANRRQGGGRSKPRPPKRGQA